MLFQDYQKGFIMLAFIRLGTKKNFLRMIFFQEPLLEFIKLDYF